MIEVKNKQVIKAEKTSQATFNLIKRLNLAIKNQQIEKIITIEKEIMENTVIFLNLMQNKIDTGFYFFNKTKEEDKEKSKNKIKREMLLSILD